MQAPHAWPGTKFQAPRRAGVQHEPHCTNKLDIVNLSYQYWEWYSPSEIQVLGDSQGP